MIGVGMAAPLEIRCEPVSPMGHAVGVEVAQPGLSAVGAVEPAEEVIEGAILHHHEHDVIDPRDRGIGQPTRLREGRTGEAPDIQGQEGSRGGDASEELTTAQTLAGSGRSIHGATSLEGNGYVGSPSFTRRARDSHQVCLRFRRAGCGCARRPQA